MKKKSCKYLSLALTFFLVSCGGNHSKKRHQPKALPNDYYYNQGNSEDSSETGSATEETAGSSSSSSSTSNRSSSSNSNGSSNTDKSASAITPAGLNLADGRAIQINKSTSGIDKTTFEPKAIRDSCSGEGNLFHHAEWGVVVCAGPNKLAPVLGKSETLTVDKEGEFVFVTVLEYPDPRLEDDYDYIYFHILGKDDDNDGNLRLGFYEAYPKPRVISFEKSGDTIDTNFGPAKIHLEAEPRIEFLDKNISFVLYKFIHTDWQNSI